MNHYKLRLAKPSKTTWSHSKDSFYISETKMQLTEKCQTVVRYSGKFCSDRGWKCTREWREGSESRKLSADSPSDLISDNAITARFRPTIKDDHSKTIAGWSFILKICCSAQTFECSNYPSSCFSCSAHSKATFVTSAIARTTESRKTLTAASLAPLLRR